MPHGLRYLANCSLMFTEHPLLSRPAAARSAGFDAIEFWWPFPDAVPSDTEVTAFVTAVRDAGVQLVGLNLFAGDMPGGDRGLISWPARSAELKDSLDVATAIAAQLGVSAFNALYGNRVDDSTPEEQDALALHNLALVSTAATSVGATVLLEPLSGAPRYPLRTAADVIKILDRANAPNVRLLADLYHLTINGDDLATLPTHAPRIAHVQIADAPGRHEPGTGTIPLDATLAALEAHGYTGWVGLEYLPTTTTEESLTWLPRPRRSGNNATLPP